MKKIISFCVIIVILSTMCGCQYSDDGISSPPAVLVFDSELAYRELLAARKLSDEELEAYLYANRPYGNYSINGIRTRAELEKFVALMDSLSPSFVKVNSRNTVESGSMSVYPIEQSIEIAYVIDERLYRFYYSIEKDAQNPINNNDNKEVGDGQTIMLMLGDVPLVLTGQWHEKSRIAYSGSVVKDGVLITCRITGIDDRDRVSSEMLSTLFTEDRSVIE